MHGMRAFALEEMNRLAEAEDAGRQAIELKRAEPWAHHAVAHVMETQGRCDEGLAFMTGLAETWADRNSFLLTHNWWQDRKSVVEGKSVSVRLRSRWSPYH